MEYTPSRRAQPPPLVVVVVSVVVVESSVVVLVDVTVVDDSVVDVTDVEVTVVEVTVDDVTVVLVPPLHGQFSGKLIPTDTLRQSSASVALTGNVPVGAQMHSGVHVTRLTAA
jgi:hypothetical protein